MLDDLINKQVMCSDVGVIQFMYPMFRIAKTKDDVIYSINTNQPFIYSGSGLLFELVKKSDVPYIIVSSSGDYNLDDRETLLELAYKKHNKKPTSSNYFLMTTKYDEFLYYFKYLWICGELPNLYIESEFAVNSLLEVIDCPRLFLAMLLKCCNDKNVNKIEEMLIMFIINSVENKVSSITNNWLYSKQQKFCYLYKRKLPNAIKNHFKLCRCLNDPTLRLFSLFNDIFYGNDCHYLTHSLMKKEQTDMSMIIDSKKQKVISSINSAKEFMTTIIMGELGCKLFKELYSDDIYFLKTPDDVIKFISTYDFETEKTVAFGDLSFISKVGQGALLKFIEETKRPLIALCSKGDITEAMRSRFCKCVRIENPLAVNEMTMGEFLKVKKRVKNKIITDRRLYSKEEYLIKTDMIKACFELNPIYWHIKSENKDSNITLEDEKIYLMCLDIIYN